jgi:hypothetical protein
MYVKTVRTHKAIPPIPPRALDAEGVAAVDSMYKLGVTQRRIATNLGVHWRTVANVVHRKKAYRDIEQRAAKMLEFEGKQQACYDSQT